MEVRQWRLLFFRPAFFCPAPETTINVVELFPVFPHSPFSARQKAHIVTVRSINIIDQEASDESDTAPHVAEAGHRAGCLSRAALRPLRWSDSLRAAKYISANRPEAISGVALPQHRPASRRSRDGGRRASQAAAHILYGRDRRRRLEDYRRRADLAERLGRLLRDGLDRRDCRGRIRPERDLCRHGKRGYPQ